MPYIPKIDKNGERLPCHVDGCGRPIYVSGVCRSHHRDRMAGSAPREIQERLKPASRTCSFPDCGRPHLAKGLCASHRHQMRIGIDLRPIRASGVGGDAVCRAPECEGETVAQSSLCRVHRGQARSFSVSDERLLEMLTQPRCEICGDELTKRHIDHDHDCCPGSGSCGNCIRGVLCPPCNLMLGQARDNVAVLAGAIEYLSAA